MGYKANLDIVICISAVRVKLFRRIGNIRYRVSLYYIQNDQKIFCRPYNILRNVPNKFNTITNQSQLDKQSQYYYSKIMHICYHDVTFIEEQSCFFRSYIDANNANNQQLKCKIQLLFATQNDNNFKIVGVFDADIHKSHNLSGYLPISFDDFEGFTVSATYHSTLMEFKFEPQILRNEQCKYDFNDLLAYVDASTQGFKRNETRRFYQYYRSILDQQIIQIYNKYSQLLKLINSHQNLLPLKLPNTQPISSLINSLSQMQRSPNNLKNQIIDSIMKQFTFLKAKIFQIWNKFIEFITYNCQKITNYYEKKYNDSVRERLRINVFSHKIVGHDWTFCKYYDSGKSNIEHALQDKNKQKDKQLWGEQFPIQNKKFFGDQNKSIKIFEEKYLVRSQQLTSRSHRTSENFRNSFKQNLKVKLPFPTQSQFYNTNNIVSYPPKIKQGHIVVLVHGFQASRQDFFLIRTCLQIRFGVEVFISTANQGRTEDSIQVLGKRLAMQLANFLVSREDDYKLSFIGHSLGGLIIRSALTFLQKIQSKLHAYISMSSPHLGYLYSASTLVHAGLWFLNTWQKAKSLQQLCMDDSSNLRQCYLYKLAKTSTLSNFQRIIFVASSQDQYTPYQSTRVQKNMKLIQERFHSNPKQQVIVEMVDSMIGRVKCQQISRINIIFDIQDKNLDSWIGRTAHVKYLSDKDFIKKFFIVFEDYLTINSNNQ